MGKKSVSAYYNCVIQDAGYKMQDARYWIPDAGYKMQDTRYRIQDKGIPISVDSNMIS